MLYTIENESLRATLSSHGAELLSLYGKKTDCEYIWQGEAPYWQARAPVVFPICGRVPDGVYTYRGKQYTISLHGFARDLEMTVETWEGTAVTFLLCDSEQTRRSYPFAFALRVKYSLSGDTLCVGYELENRGDDQLIFAFGGHPGIRLPMQEGRAEDYRFVFEGGENARRLQFSDRGLTLREMLPYPLKDGVLPFSHSLFDEGGVFLTDVGETVSLVSDRSARGVTVRFPGYSSVGLWHDEKTEAPFVCIEPWQSIPSYEDVREEDLERKPRMNRLPKGQRYESAYYITVL